MPDPAGQNETASHITQNDMKGIAKGAKEKTPKPNDCNAVPDARISIRYIRSSQTAQVLPFHMNQEVKSGTNAGMTISQMIRIFRFE